MVKAGNYRPAEGSFKQSRGARLREAMRQSGYAKQYAFAVALVVNESTVTRWLANGPMSLDHSAKVCLVLDISLDWLVLGRGTMHSHKVTPGDLRDPVMERIQDLYDELRPESKRHLDGLIQSLRERKH